MSLNDIEFVSPEQVVIKSETEYFMEDNNDLDPNSSFSSSANHNKCGEVFTSNNVDFMFCCAYCQGAYYNLNEFGEHLRRKHINPVDNFLEENYLEEEYKSESDNELSSANELVSATSDVEAPHREEKSKKEARYACTACKKRYVYKVNLQRHKCPVADQKKEETPKEGRLEQMAFEAGSIKVEKGEAMHDFNGYLSGPNDLNFKEESLRETDDDHIRICKLCGENVIDGQHECLCVDGGPEADGELGPPNPELFCDICYRQFKYRNVFRKHGMQHEVGPTALRNDPNYRKCAECKLQFTNNADWLEHETNHPKIKPYQCTFCQKKYKTDIELEMHTKNHTIEGPVKCEQCGTDFVRYKNLVSHINRVHLQLKPFACTLCDKKFPQNAELRVHMRRHTGERPYQCEECGQSFMVATKLNEHLKRHAGVRDVQCPVCPMAFVTKKMLRKHMVKHSTERPHVCATCGNTFSRRKALLAHIKIHLDVKEYVCHLCGKAFAQHAGLYMHRKTHLND